MKRVLIEMKHWMGILILIATFIGIPIIAWLDINGYIEHGSAYVALIFIAFCFYMAELEMRAYEEYKSQKNIDIYFYCMIN